MENLEKKLCTVLKKNEDVWGKCEWGGEKLYSFEFRI